MKKNREKIDWRTKKIFLHFMQISVLFLAFGLLYYYNLFQTHQFSSYFSSIYLFIESAFYLPAIGIASATIFEWLIRKNK